MKPRSKDKTQEKSHFAKRKVSPLKGVDPKLINYKNPDLLSKFTSDGGRTLSRRITNAPAKYQRKIAKQIKLARDLAIMPYVSGH